MGRRRIDADRCGAVLWTCGAGGASGVLAKQGVAADASGLRGTD
jgi:hypothetical protein